MSTSQELCSVCRAFDLYSFRRDVEGYRGYAFEKVVSGAKQGCRFCAMLYDCYKSLRTDEPYIHLRLDQGSQSESTSLGVVGIHATLGYRTAFERDWDREGKHVYLTAVADSGQYAPYS